MNYHDYIASQRAQYDEFAKAIRRIIEHVLDAHPEIPRPQQIQARAKTPGSLARKLQERGLTDSQTIESDLKDLAGVRLIFYTNADVDHFLGSRVIQENFKVDYDASNFHHPIGPVKDVNEHYRAIHYVVELNDDRSGLAEYAAFKGMRCEIQMQTTLHHAWSETAHDILYHSPDKSGFGSRQFEQIKTRMARIMERYLLPAADEFVKVQHDFRRWQQGKALIDQDIFTKLADADNNNDRYELLTRIKEDLMPQYDDLAVVAGQLRQAAIDAIEAGRKSETKPVETTFGSFEGKSEQDVTEAALAILRPIRYVDIGATFSALRGILPGAKSHQERKTILEALDALAKNNLEVWKQAGPYVQEVLIGLVDELTPAEREQDRSLVLRICKNALSPAISAATSTTYNTITLYNGPVKAGDRLATNRGKALDLTFSLYETAQTHEQRFEGLDVFREAMHLPTMGYEDSLWLLVLRDSKAIIDFFEKRTTTEPLKLLLRLEEECLTLHQQYLGVKRNPSSDVQIAAAYEALERSITSFRSALAANDKYQKFKTLVGWNTPFDEYFTEKEISFREREKIRERRINGYVATFDRKRDEWLELVLEFAKDHDSWQHLRTFLKKIGQQKALAAVQWLKSGRITEQHLIMSLGLGLLSGLNKKGAADLFNTWIEDGKNLAAMAWLARASDELPKDFLLPVGKKAIALSDFEALGDVVAGAIEKGQEIPNTVEELLLPAAALLSEAGNWSWITQLPMTEDEVSTLSSLNEDQAATLIRMLTKIPRIDFHVERFLLPLAEINSSEVIQLFKERIDIETAKDKEERFDAIPYELDQLAAPLSANPQSIIQTVRSWHKPGDYLFKYRGGRLLQLVFPGFPAPFASALQQLVTDEPEAIDFVLDILANYQGQSALHETFKVIIDLLPEGDQRLSTVESYLEQTGVVSGAFGFVDAFRRKMAEVEPWLSDQREKVRKFTEHYVRSLKRASAAEQRRAEQDHTLRRHDFDPDGE
jgi:ppGpp synthetase/RelA/SpoT-type nucleotidyltranferase